MPEIVAPIESPAYIGGLVFLPGGKPDSRLRVVLVCVAFLPISSSQNLISNGEANEVRLGMQSKFSHEVRTMCLRRAAADE